MFTLVSHFQHSIWLLLRINNVLCLAVFLVARRKWHIHIYYNDDDWWNDSSFHLTPRSYLSSAFRKRNESKRFCAHATHILCCYAYVITNHLHGWLNSFCLLWLWLHIYITYVMWVGKINVTSTLCMMIIMINKNELK